MTSFAKPSRRMVVLTGAAFGVAAFAPRVLFAQNSTAAPQSDSAEADRIAQAFIAGGTVVAEGLALDLPALGDNPAAVPVRVHVVEEITDTSYCEEIIILAERNPMPLACRMRFSAATGAADVAVRLRLIETMAVRALARMNDGRILDARGTITVAAGGCGL